jgi:hypothetical protein
MLSSGSYRGRHQTHQSLHRRPSRLAKHAGKPLGSQSPMKTNTISNIACRVFRARRWRIAFDDGSYIKKAIAANYRWSCQDNRQKDDSGDSIQTVREQHEEGQCACDKKPVLIA